MSTAFSYAFVAVVAADGYSIGIAERDRPGYVPYPDGGTFPTFSEAHAAAAKLNARLGHSTHSAYVIVATSLRGLARSVD